MKSITFILLLLGMLVFFTCTKKVSAKEKDLAQIILEKAIQAHGGSKYDNAHYAFVFRKNLYTFQNKDGQYYYTVAGKTKDGNAYFNALNNSGFKRTINAVEQDLTPKEIARYTNSLNSVIYFATLPHKLKDPAVNKIYKGTTTIKNKNYEVLQISFNEEGGGKDHEDIYYYWINQQTNFIDYLAYNFLVNGGGVRFRSAYHPRMVDGIRFQDYVNYKAPKGTPLADLPGLLEKGELEKLSVIETEKVQNLKN